MHHIVDPATGEVLLEANEELTQRVVSMAHEQGVDKIDADSSESTSLKLDIPDTTQTRGTHLFFIVSYEILEQKIPTRFYYRLLVDTAGAPKLGAGKAER